jgi:cyclohexyl-isocyanide hydratase
MTDAPSSDRRQMLQAAAAAALAAMAGRGASAAEAHADHAGHGGMKPVRTAMLIHPQMVLMDLVGPMTFFSMMRGEMHLVWKDKAPVSTDVGIPIAATTAFKDCPADLDILFVPGGLEGSTALMDDAEVLGFLADRGGRAKYVTSVCTGSLVLGAAGLLKGYRATSLWNVRDLLALMGATVVPERVVVDRNRITGGGVTAGLDFGLLIARAIMGEEHAKHFQLALEYDPDPPMQAGSPEKAGPETTKFILDGRGPAMAAARAKAMAAGRRI